MPCMISSKRLLINRKFNLLTLRCYETEIITSRLVRCICSLTSNCPFSVPTPSVTTTPPPTTAGKMYSQPLGTFQYPVNLQASCLLDKPDLNWDFCYLWLFLIVVFSLSCIPTVYIYIFFFSKEKSYSCMHITFKGNPRLEFDQQLTMWTIATTYLSHCFIRVVSDQTTVLK